MADTDAPDITTNWSLRRGSSSERTSRFNLDIVVDAQFIDPTRDEVRTALLQTLDEALGVDTGPSEIAGWEVTDLDEALGLVGKINGGLDQLNDELEHLRAWKAEALPLLGILDRCHDALPERHQASLGHSKADAVLEFLISDSWVLRPQVD